MQLKILSRLTLLVVIFVGLIFFLAPSFYSFSKNLNQSNLASFVENTPVSLSQEQENFELPVRLKIPVINVDSTIEHVGITSDGAMDIPKNQDDVAWLKIGSRPGDMGNAVISGHYGWKNSIPAAFDNLYKLQRGDKLYIEDGKGLIITFIVRESRTYDWDADASDVFSSNDEKVHLNLITCEGAWDKTQKSYSKRLVVFTDKE